MAKSSKKKKSNKSTGMLALFQHDTFSIFFLLSISSILGGSLYLLYAAA